MAKVGDIAYIDFLGKLQFCTTEEWSSLIGEPVGVVAIPADFLPDSPEMRLIAIYGVDSAGTRNETGHTKSKWCSANTYDIPELDNYYNEGPCLDVESNRITGYNGEYLCSDKFNIQMNPYDPGYGWNTTEKTIAPSPYKEDGSFNEQIKDNTYFPFDGKLNPFTDFNDKENTDILVGLGTAYEAANATRKYKAYDGDTLEWYLPSAGELVVYMHDFNKINEAISKAGGVKLSVSYYWSSIEYSDSRAITLHPDYGILTDYYKDINALVRPFALI